MDIVAVEDHGTGHRLVFYEAKLFSNSELRARDYNPRVLARQLTDYRNYVSHPERRTQVLEAYRETCKFNGSVSEMRGAQLSESVAAVANGAPLDLDPQPRLIIYGFKDGDLAGNSAWKKHEEVLRAKTTVIMAPTANEVVLPFRRTAL